MTSKATSIIKIICNMEESCLLRAYHLHIEECQIILIYGQPVLLKNLETKEHQGLSVVSINKPVMILEFIFCLK